MIMKIIQGTCIFDPSFIRVGSLYTLGGCNESIYLHYRTKNNCKVEITLKFLSIDCNLSVIFTNHYKKFGLHRSKF